MPSKLVSPKKPSQEYFNFINSINSEETKKQYAYCLDQFLKYHKLDLKKFLHLPQQQMTNLIIAYLVQKKVSKALKNVIFASIKHACDMNDILLNWRKMKKFARSGKTGNEIFGKDRGYEHKEIQQILEYSEQRVKTAFLILASTGMRIGHLSQLKIEDLQRIQDLYKITVYSGDKEQYITFTTPECAKEIDAYLEFRKRRGDQITGNSYLMVKKFKDNQKTKPFKGDSLSALLHLNINNSGVRDPNINRYKRQQIPLLHGFRKFFTKQLQDSKVNPEIIRRLHGWDTGLMGHYYKPTEQDMLNEYLKAVPLLTISNEERLKFKLEEHVKIEKTTMAQMQERMDQLQNAITQMKKKRRK